MKLDLHNHTWYSPDSITSPREFIRRSKAQGVVLAVTEHGNGDSWKALVAESKRHHWPFIRGEEQRVYRGDAFAGELIGLFLHEPIRARQVDDFLDEVHRQDGLVLVPHPFDNRLRGSAAAFNGLEEIVNRIDLVEVFNARIRAPQRNDLAADFAARHNKPVSAGSDAHLPWEISNCHVHVEAEDLEEARKSLLRNKSLGDVHRTHPVNFVATQFFRRVPFMRRLVTRKKEKDLG
jgi:predicted metal-dependent phosphoesterase TrpH